MSSLIAPISWLVRGLVLFSLAIPGLLRHEVTASHSRQISGDNRTLATASAKAVSRSGTLRFLRHQPDVSLAVYGRDHRTIDIRFRDGQQAAILPSERRVPVLGNPRLAPHLQSSAAPAAGLRAAVWEPFATELKLSPHAGDLEVQDLQAAGFAVDQAYDTNVTVATMASLSDYSVVYMDTHSGVNQWGEGVIATGQLATDDASVAPLLADGSLLKVGVAGSTDIYYGILSHYVTAHLSSFPAGGAVLFLNGCTLLKGSLVWNAFAAKGAKALVSWDNDVDPKDANTAGSLFFAEMAHGLSVSDSIRQVQLLGYGFSHVPDQSPSYLGYLGDGSVTLRSLAAPPPTSTPLPTATSPASPTPVPTVTPTAALAAGRPSVSIVDLLLQARSGRAWKTTSVIRMRTPARFEAHYQLRNASDLSPKVDLTITKQGRVLRRSHMELAPGQDGTRQFYMSERFGSKSMSGQLRARLVLSAGSSSGSRSITFGVRP